MGNLKKRKNLKKRFEDGDRPDGNDFAKLIDSFINQKSDEVYVDDHKLGIGTKNPDAPLEVKGSNGKQECSVIASNGHHSTFRIAHPRDNVVAIGSDAGESMQIGNFDNQCDDFSPKMYIYKDKVGIGDIPQHAELDVKTTLWVGESIGLGASILEFKDEKLYLKIGKQTFRILTEEKDSKPKPNSPLKIVLFVLGCIFLFIAICVLIVLIFRGL